MAEIDQVVIRKWSLLLDTGIAAAGMCLFGSCAHFAVPLKFLSFFGLFLTTLAIVYGLRRETSPAALVGVKRVSPRVAAYTVWGVLIGISLGFLYRWGYNLELQPARFGRFALVGALIGATEEVLYRGYLQGRLRRVGPFLAVALAALYHTAYKSALFAFPPFPLEIDFPFFSGTTFAAGAVFGGLRERAGSVVPPLAAHVGFDLIVYGGYAHAPWWVWS